MHTNIDGEFLRNNTSYFDLRRGLIVQHTDEFNQYQVLPSFGGPILDENFQVSKQNKIYTIKLKKNLL